jgi:hypothetical protein
MNLTCVSSNTKSLSVSLRECVLFVAILGGVSVTVITEILSTFNLITYGWLVVFWSVVLLGSTSFVIILMKRQRLVVLSPFLRLPFHAIPLLAGLVLIVTLTGVTAFLSPPNNWDSLVYHMSRVVHWIQDRNVSFYPTHSIRQLYANPWAEFAIMHLQILSGGDRFANFVQWFSMIGCLIGVSLLAKQFGGDLQTQLFAAVFAGTIPMGILQSSSTQTDYAVSFWLLCFVYFSISLIRQGQIHWPYALVAGFSLGLALLTKQISYIFVVSFVVWAGYSFLRRFRFKSWKPALLIGVACVALNFGQYARNFSLFGSPIYPRAQNFESIDRNINDVISPSSILSNITRNIGLHLGTPSWRVNSGINDTIEKFHQFLNIDINDPRTTDPTRKFQVPQPSLQLHEDYAGNLLHLSLILGAGFLFFISKEIRRSRVLLSYLVCLLSGFLLFCALVKWFPYNSRYQLPLFVLASPFVGAVLSKTLNKKVNVTIAFALLVAALPWVLLNRSRSLLGLLGNPSVWNHSRSEEYFNNRPDVRDAYLKAAYFLKSNKCGQIGLDIGYANDWEYPFWALLNPAAKHAIRIEHVHVKNESGAMSLLPKFRRFSPCEIISTRPDQVDELATETGAYTKKWALSPISVFVRKAPLQVPETAAPG